MAKLLLVDDDVVFLDVLTRALQRRGHVIVRATNALQAIAATDTGAFDGIVLDLRLGQDNGLQCLRDLRHRQPHAAILLLTGFSSIATAVEAVKRGANDYLPKPASADDILAAMFPEASASVDVPTTPIHPRRLEWEHLQRVMAEHDGNISSAARALGLHRRTLQRKLAKRPVPER